MLGPLLQELHELLGPPLAHKSSVSPLFLRAISSELARFAGSLTYHIVTVLPGWGGFTFSFQPMNLCAYSENFSFTLMGSGDAILCADHPILGQAVIVLHLDYPNCYESQDAFSSGHVECTSLPHRSDVFLAVIGQQPLTFQFFLLYTRNIELKRRDQMRDHLRLAIDYVIRIPVI